MPRLNFALLSWFLLFVADEAGAACPAPSEMRQGHCALKADAVLMDTMWIPSGTTLNCKGYQLTPSVAGTLDDPTTTVNEFGPSQPELAIFVHRAHGVKIQNCDISGFDFGIVVAQSKTADAPPGVPTKTKIAGNTIDVRTNAIDLIKSDNVTISDNALTYASERGRGVVLDYDSDDNTIVGNTITSTDAASTGLVRQVPSGPMVSGTAVMDNEIHCVQGSDRPMVTFVVSGVLVQVSAADSGSVDTEDSWRPDHNLIEDNDIVDLGFGDSCTLDPTTPCRVNADCTGKGVCLIKQNSGIGFNLRAADTLVSGNRLSGRMGRGVSFGGSPAVTTLTGWYPGTCEGDATRMCSSDFDCNVPGYDTVNLGPCNGAAPITFNGNTLRLTAEGNTLSGVYADALFANNTASFTFRGNVIQGGASGIRANNTAIGGLIERNAVSGAGNALYLGSQPTFSQQIRLNDFTDYSVGIRTSNDFTASTDISAEKGNYWGLPCPGFGSGLVFFDNGNPNPNVFDGKPYGEPVAETPEDQLPPACSTP